MKTLIIFVMLAIHFTFSDNFINATGFNESYSLRGGLLTVNEGGFLFNMMEKDCGIYKIISPTKKIYIGKSANLSNRRQNYSQYHCKSQRKLYNSLMKYGWDKHKFEIICECSESELNELEIYYIKYYESFNTKHGLNLRKGGEGGHMSEETKRRISISSRNRLPISEETRNKLSKAKKGKKRTDETKLKISLGHKGIRCKEETKLKISLAKKGKKQSFETLKKLSEARKGKKRSLEVRQKMSIAQTKAWVLRKKK